MARGKVSPGPGPASDQFLVLLQQRHFLSLVACPVAGCWMFISLIYRKVIHHLPGDKC